MSDTTNSTTKGQLPLSPNKHVLNLEDKISFQDLKKFKVLQAFDSFRYFLDPQSKFCFPNFK